LIVHALTFGPRVSGATGTNEPFSTYGSLTLTLRHTGNSNSKQLTQDKRLQRGGPMNKESERLSTGHSSLFSFHVKEKRTGYRGCI